MTPNANKESVKMSDNDLGTILATFLKSQKERDAIFRDDLSRISRVASEAGERAAESLTRIEGVDGKIETAFDLLNQSAADKMTKWPTIFAGAVVLGSMVAFILIPIRTDIHTNRNELQTNHMETRSMIHALQDVDTKLQIAQAVIAERHMQEQRLNRAWVDPTGRIAYPNITN